MLVTDCLHIFLSSISLPIPVSNGEVTSLPMYDQSHGDTPIKYVGIDIEINKKKVRFMIDTGATINLIKKQTISQLGMSAPQFSHFISHLHFCSL